MTELLPREFHLSLPVTSNHQYEPIIRRTKAGRLAHGKRWSEAYQVWRDEAALVVRGWEPPPHVPLAVSIDLYIPRRLGRRCDIEGFVKGLIDATVGARNDQYVDYLLVLRRSATDDEGHAEVLIQDLRRWCG